MPSGKRGRIRSDHMTTQETPETTGAAEAPPVIPEMLGTLTHNDRLVLKTAMEEIGRAHV